MRVKPSNILLLPGWQNSGVGHWQTHWQSVHGYHRVEQHDWMRPLRGDWSARLEETVLDADGPVVLVGSRNDPYCSFERAQGLANAWGARFVDLGDSGHINAESGLADWPHGQALLQTFLKD